MGRPKKKVDSPEERLAQFWLKSVAAGCGLYNPASGSFVDDLEEQGLYHGNVSVFANALKSGWTYDELQFWIGQQYKNGERNALASDILPKKEREDSIRETDDLMDEDTDYFHDALYDTTPPRFAVAGSVMLPVSRGSITRKQSFTLRELMDYYYANVKTACVARRRETQTKTMAWLLSQAELDEILYAIDAAGLTDDDVPVVELTNYFDEAQRELTYHRARHQ